MALTRAQLLAGDTATGTPILSGQVQGVRQGVGVLILPDGTINFDASTAVGVMRLNDPNAYNAYVWPVLAGPPAAGTILQTDGTGQLVWTSDYVPTIGTTSTNAALGAAQLPSGASANRPTPPALGLVRYNTDLNKFEGYGGAPASWEPLGASPATLAEAAAGVITTKYSSPETAVPKDAAGMNGAAILPAGTSAQQPAAPVDGMFRFNADNDAFEGYGQNLTAWEPLMPTGASTDKVVYLNEQIVTTDYTLPAAPIIKNGLSAGPITISAGVTVTVPAGQAWSIV